MQALFGGGEGDDPFSTGTRDGIFESVVDTSTTEALSSAPLQLSPTVGETPGELGLSMPSSVAEGSFDNRVDGALQSSSSNIPPPDSAALMSGGASEGSDFAATSTMQHQPFEAPQSASVSCPALLTFKADVIFCNLN